jgi:hypothetical protein
MPPRMARTALSVSVSQGPSDPSTVPVVSRTAQIKHHLPVTFFLLEKGDWDWSIFDLGEFRNINVTIEFHPGQTLPEFPRSLLHVQHEALVLEQGTLNHNRRVRQLPA